MPFEKYFEWVEKWLKECYRVLKDDGRIAINIPVEVSNQHDESGHDRVFMLSEYHQIMKTLNFHTAGVIRLAENHPQIRNRTAWGSWMSASAPYIRNPDEHVLLYYKNQWKRLTSGTSTMTKEDFIKNVSGRWDYIAETKCLTAAGFSLDFPLTAINMLTYKDVDVVLDPFMGSGTTALACVMTDRQYIGFEISENYWKIANNRIQNHVDRGNCALKDMME